MNKTDASATRANDEELIIQLDKDFMSALNNRNFQVLPKFFTDDAVRVGPTGDVQQGPQKILDALEKIMNESFAGQTILVKNETVRMLGNDYAILKAEIEISSPEKTESKKGYGVQIMKRVENQWRILEIHPKLFPPVK